MEPLKIFESVVWKGHYNGDLSELQKAARHQLTTSPRLNTALEKDGGISSSSDPNYPHTWDETQEFIKWLHDPAATVWHQWGYPDVNRTITNSWANLHPTGAYTEQHTHGPAKQVVVLYLQQPEHGGYLEVQNPLFYHWQGYYRGQPEWFQVPVQTGDVVIFPGWLLHRSQKNKSELERMIISFNIGS